MISVNFSTNVVFLFQKDIQNIPLGAKLASRAILQLPGKLAFVL